jgi:hypothetical protein
MDLVSIGVTLLVGLVAFGLIWWAAHKIAAAFGLPEQVNVLIDVGLVILGVALFIGLIAGRISPIRL